MPIVPFGGTSPVLGEGCFVAPSAWVIGQCTIAASCSIFFSSVLRGDILPIEVGEGTNLQEHVLLHTSRNGTPCVVHEFVTVGHRAIIHGGRVKHHTLIGMGATVLDGAVVGPYSMIGAHSLVTAGAVIPEGVLAVGTPAKVIRALTAEEKEALEESARHYMLLGRQYIELLGGGFPGRA